MVANELVSAAGSLAAKAATGAGAGSGAQTGATVASVLLTEGQALMLLFPIGVIGLFFGLYQILWLSNNTTLA